MFLHLIRNFNNRPTPGRARSSRSHAVRALGARRSIALALLLSVRVLAQQVDPLDAGVEEPTLTPRETVVVGTPEWRTAGSAHTIGGARLKRFELDDAHAVLQAVPGVSVRGEDGFGLRPNIGLRGANPDRSKKVTLLEDGVLFGPAPYSAPAAYYFPLMTRMEAVRVVKGPSAIVYGPQTVGGAIDFVTRDFGPGVSASFDGALGQYLTGKAHGVFSAANETSGFLLEGVHLRSDGFKVLDTVGGSTGFERTEWMVKGRHRLDTGALHHTLQLKLGFSSERSNETYLGLSDADFRASPLRRYVSSELDLMQWHRTQLVLSYRLEAPTWTLTTTAYRNDFHRAWRKLNRFGDTAVADVLANPDTPRNALYLSVLRGEADSTTAGDSLFVGPNQRDFVSQGVESVFRTTAQTGPVTHALEGKARYHFDSIARLHTEDELFMREGRLQPAGEATDVLIHNYDFTHAVALSATDAMSWGALTLTPGVRVELISSASNDFLAETRARGSASVVLPGIGAHFAVTERLGVLAGAYRGFSPPAPGQPSSTLPELSLNAEGGARWTRRGERLEAIAFFNDYANLTDICTFSNGCVGTNLDRQFSAGRANIYGLEVFGEKRLKLGEAALPLSLAYTFTGSRMLQQFRSEDPVFGNVQPGDELPYVPRHQLNAAAGVDWNRLSVHAQLFFIDRMREQAGQGAFIEGLTTDVQVVVDAHLAVKLTEWAQVYFDARNLFDGHFIVGRKPFGARPNAPRTLLGGVKLTY
ncbi:MAG: TonB-dependent receptor [Archangium sp.]|nr:TonB-dependent receptor [Archangium sp.]